MTLNLRHFCDAYFSANKQLGPDRGDNVTDFFVHEDVETPKDACEEVVPYIPLRIQYFSHILL